jgi:serine/threonine-protein kinase
MRAATLAVERFGADRARVAAAYQAVLRARAAGKPAELLDALAAEHVLSAGEADKLRQEINGSATRSPKDNLSEGTVPIVPPPVVQADSAETDDGSQTPSGYRLRQLGGYRLLRRLGQGGMGSVYLGYDEATEQQVAIKVLSHQLASNQGYVERFHREAKSGALLNHPNIVRCIAAGLDKATAKHYLVLEFVDGTSADALLDRMGRLPVADAVHIALDVARALEHAHSRNIIHRDIKPDNILITRSGVAKLSDLGLAKRTDEPSSLTALRQGFGSLPYIPYEQAFDAKEADARSDIYALGATLYHLLTGEVPFAGKSQMEIAEKKLQGDYAPASSLNPDVPAVLDHIIDRMMARDPADRYQMASELIVDLERAGLAALVPSFVDAELAMRDPVVRVAMQTAQPTQLDLHARLPQSGPANGDVWYLRFRNRQGKWAKTKMTAQQLKTRLAEGRVSGDVGASRNPNGEFRPLWELTEFRNAARMPVAGKPPSDFGASSSALTARKATEPLSNAGPEHARRHPWKVIVASGMVIGLCAVISLAVYRYMLSP